MKRKHPFEGEFRAIKYRPCLACKGKNSMVCTFCQGHEVIGLPLHDMDRELYELFVRNR